MPTFRERVTRVFATYDVDPADDSSAYFSSQDPQVMTEMFDALREEVGRDGHFPLLVKRKADYAFYILRRPQSREPAAWVAPALAIATLASLTLFGAVLAHSRAVDLGAAPIDGTSLTAPYLALGMLEFAIPVLSVLAAQAGARALAAHRAGIAAPRLYFVPVPPPLPFGTLGAFTPMRDPVPTRRAQVWIGASGILAGTLAALLVLGAGLLVSGNADGSGPGVALGEPWAMRVLGAAFHAESAALHPLAVAGWIGLFLVTLHGIPLGQTDGALVARGLLGRHARILAAAALATIVALGFLWSPWWLIGVALALSGPVPPQALNEVSHPGWKAWVLVGACALAVLASFSVVPLAPLP